MTSWCCAWLGPVYHADSVTCYFLAIADFGLRILGWPSYCLYSSYLKRSTIQYKRPRLIQPGTHLLSEGLSKKQRMTSANGIYRLSMAERLLLLDKGLAFCDISVAI